MPASFSSLGTQNVHPVVQTFLDMFRVADHVHVQDSIGMQAIHDFPRRDANRAYKQPSLGFDDDIDELGQVALGVVVAVEVVSGIYDSM